MSELDRLYANATLFGHDPTPRLVAVERDRSNQMTLYFRDPAEDGGPGPLRVESDVLEPFVYLNSPQLLSGFEAPVRLEPLGGAGFYRHLAHLESWSTAIDLMRHLKKVTGSSQANPSGPFFFLNDEVGQYLVATGRTLFKGMRHDEVHRLQFDLEIYCTPGYEFPNADREGDRIIIASLTDNFGWERCLAGPELSEEELIHELIRVIRERDPDVIEGHNLFKFDLPYLEARARRYRIPLTLGRDGSVMSGHPSRFQVAERVFSYQKYAIFGRHIIDTMFLALLYDVSHRNLESFGLKDIARHFGLSPANRTYVDGDRISWSYDHDRGRLLDYAMDDVRETRAVSELLGRSYFFQAQIFPLSFQNVVIRGNATRIDHLFIRAYYRRRQALPACPVGRSYEGGYTDMRVQGVLRHELHCDVRSLYPSVMLAFDFNPTTDALGIFPELLRDLRTFRLNAKAAVRTAPTRAEREQADALQLTFKVLINSFYGYLGFAHGHFADFHAAEKVTARGRELIKHMVSWLEQQGATIIEIDTDGIYFLAPPSIQDAAGEEALIARLNETLPDGIEAELDGRYAGMFSYKVKNYVLLGQDGQLIIKGSGLRSRAVELFQRRFLEGVFAHLLAGTAPEIGALYLRFRDDILHHRWRPTMFVKRESLQDSLATYQQKLKERKRPPTAAYELALRSGRDYQPGDPVAYYVTGNKKNVKVFEAARMADQWKADAPDENVTYYQAKLEDLYRKFEPFIVEAGGPSLAELSTGQVSLLLPVGPPREKLSLEHDVLLEADDGGGELDL